MLLKINASIYLEAPDDSDPQEVASRMNAGLESALDGFPVGMVELAEVDGVELVSPAEAEEKGLVDL